MRFSSKIILAVAIFTSNAYTTCNRSGDNWNIIRKDVSDMVENVVCDYLTSNGTYGFNLHEVRTYPTVNQI